MSESNPLDELDIEAIMKPLNEKEIIARQREIIRRLTSDRIRLESLLVQTKKRIHPEHAYRVAQIAAQVLTAGAGTLKGLTPDGALDLARYLVENAVDLESK